MASDLQLVASSRCYGGDNRRYSHTSTCCACTMKFHIYLPPQVLADPSKKYPALYFLSGLTCTDENFITKSGVQRFAAESGIIIIAPDTSPRGLGFPDEAKDWDFGVGAGFYVDATQEPWCKAWKMYTYVTKELPELINANFPVDPSRVGIFGHSMGGHGALICALKNPNQYKSVSAFAPISHPTECPWGVKAFTGYLGEDKEAWKQYDATELAKTYNGPKLHILIDQGLEDKFLEGQLKPEDFEKAVTERSGGPLTVEVRRHAGYDHSYYFITTFIEDHIKHHAKYL